MYFVVGVGGGGGGGQKEYSGVCLFFDRVRAATMCRLLVNFNWDTLGLALWYWGSWDKTRVLVLN